MRLNKKFLTVVLVFVISGAFSANKLLSFLTNSLSSPPPTVVPAIGTVEVAFSPNNGATATVIKAISEAKKKILVSAYSFTSSDIAKALLDAEHRGVDVKIILDKSQVGQQYSSATFFANNGFNLRIDKVHAIYHDKVMIIDDKTVLTGSFNFTKAAEKKNAENVLVLRDNPPLAKLYTADWLNNWNQAVIYADYKAASKSKKYTNDE